MTRELALLIIVAFTVVLIGIGVWAWRRRGRRDAGMTAPVGELPEGAEIVGHFSGFYVATTRHDEPLERLAIRGLAFRSRVSAVISTAGLALDLPGQPRYLIDRARIVAADRATVAIDRVVEKGGLVRVAWHVDDTTIVDSYFRSQDSSARAVAHTLTSLLPAPTDFTPTGTDA